MLRALFLSCCRGAESDAGDFRRVEPHARTHARGERDLLDIFALGARRLGLENRIDEGVKIGLEVGFGEARLADPGVDDPGLFDAKLNLAGLGETNRFADIQG